MLFYYLNSCIYLNNDIWSPLYAYTMQCCGRDRVISGQIYTCYQTTRRKKKTRFTYTNEDGYCCMYTYSYIFTGNSMLCLCRIGLLSRHSISACAHYLRTLRKNSIDNRCWCQWTVDTVTYLLFKSWNAQSHIHIFFKNIFAAFWLFLFAPFPSWMIAGRLIHIFRVFLWIELIIHKLPFA